MQNTIITIDGPGGSGKSTLAQQLATHLRFKYLNTGYMYRSLTLMVIKNNKDPENEQACMDLAHRMSFEIERQDKDFLLLLNGQPVSEEIKSEIVDKNVSLVSRHPGVREIMVEKQRYLGRDGRIIVEGRDAGTCVFQNAAAKIYVTASLEERAMRRFREYSDKGINNIHLNEIQKDLKKRDEIDSLRKHSPLAKASDAIVLDTTGLTKEEKLEKALEILREKNIIQE